MDTSIKTYLFAQLEDIKLIKHYCKLTLTVTDLRAAGFVPLQRSSNIHATFQTETAAQQ